jgi:hypothetical protein
MAPFLACLLYRTLSIVKNTSNNGRYTMDAKNSLRADPGDRSRAKQIAVTR